MEQLAHGRRPVGRPRGSTRERILDVALELFTEQGYDKTSLREIADGLGFTKAALYHHFARKEDILLALHLRLHALGGQALDTLAGIEDPAKAVELWPRLLDQAIDLIVENRSLFLLHSRNHSAMEQLEQHGLHDLDHDDLQARVRRILANPAMPRRDRVRLGVGLVAVAGTMMLGPEIFDADLDDLVGDLRSAIRDLFS